MFDECFVYIYIVFCYVCIRINFGVRVRKGGVFICGYFVSEFE